MQDFTDKDIEALVGAVLRHDAAPVTDDQMKTAKDRLLSRAAALPMPCVQAVTRPTLGQRTLAVLRGLNTWLGHAIHEDTRYDRARAYGRLTPHYAFGSIPSVERYFFLRPVPC
jgi:hypothetical protein